MSSLKSSRPPFSDEELARYKERYMWDTRHTTDEPDTEAYGYDNIQMFRDLESAERRAEDEYFMVNQLKMLLDGARDENRQLKTALNDCWENMGIVATRRVQHATRHLAIKVHNELDHE